MSKHQTPKITYDELDNTAAIMHRAKVIMRAWIKEGGSEGISTTINDFVISGVSINKEDGRMLVSVTHLG